MSAPLLEVEGLTVAFPGQGEAVRDLSLSLAAGETLGLVGESGAGKSVTALTLMGLLPPRARVTAGQIRFAGEALLPLEERRLRRLRGRRIALVFQNPRAALNPIRPVGRQLEDLLRHHRGLARRAAEQAAVALLAEVGIPEAERRFHAHAFQLSGGLCQRVTLALALAGEPALLIADEPTTGLDVTTQAVILDLLAGLARRRGLATLLITHDLALAAERCARIAVMQQGRIVETAPSEQLFAAPAHPYSRALLAATPWVFGGSGG